MPIVLLKKLKQEARQDGFLYFVKLKAIEQIYKYRFKKLAVDYGKCTDDIANPAIHSANDDANANQPSPYYELKKAFSFIKINAADICLLDIGCGYGRALNFGMYLKFKKVIGIDLDDAVVEKAMANCGQMKLKGYNTAFDVYNEDAGHFAIPAGTNLIYLFNPFGKKTMEQVVENIFKYKPDKYIGLFVIYSMPTHQELFTIHKQCVKIYERFNGAKTQLAMAIFKISV